MNIGIKKTDTHEEVTVKALSDSGTTGVFIDKRLATKQGFKLQKLKRSLVAKNMDRTYNSREAITH